ncbi:hypothetical protein BDB01DRAFT_311903 [Pilobolus umbonatus]|nr:hypothetical protein BDB01DRAFT_311903 [Pilobolus umbonatus]
MCSPYGPCTVYIITLFSCVRAVVALSRTSRSTSFSIASNFSATPNCLRRRHLILSSILTFRNPLFIDTISLQPLPVSSSVLGHVQLIIHHAAATLTAGSSCSYRYVR